MNLIWWTLIILMDCCSDWWVVALHQIDLIKRCTDHMPWISCTTLTINIELVEMIWAMDDRMPSIWTLLLIWVEVVVTPIKTITSLSTIQLVIVRASNIIKGTMMWPNCDLRSSRVILSSVNCRAIPIITCIQRVTASIHDMRLPYSIFISKRRSSGWTITHIASITAVHFPTNRPWFPCVLLMRASSWSSMSVNTIKLLLLYSILQLLIGVWWETSIAERQ